MEVAKQTQSFLQEDLNMNHRGTINTVELATKQASVNNLLAKLSGGKHTVVVSTPMALVHLLRSDASAPPTRGFDLILANDLDTLSPEYELVLACLMSTHTCARIVGFSAPLLDATTLAAWLRVNEANKYSFHPSSRPTPIVSSSTTFTLPHSPGLLKAMIKPAYDSMRSNPGQSICFVPHRGQCYITLTDLLTHSATDMNSFVSMDEYTLSQYTDRIADPKIAEGLLHGFAVLCAGAHPTDQAIAKHLFKTGAVRVLIVPRKACHSLDLTAALVIVMSTQYAVFQPETGERTILDYSMGDIFHMQTRAKGAEQDQTGQFSIFTQPDNASLISRFMNDGLPLESSLLDSTLLMHTMLARIAAVPTPRKQDLLSLLATTFTGHRVVHNPAYYGCEGDSRPARVSRVVDSLVERWRQALLVRTKDTMAVSITAFGTAFNAARLSLSRVEKLFSLSESRALKLASGLVQPAVPSDQLEAYVNRLSKTLQRRIRPESDEQPLDPKRALLIPFLAKKLAPQASEVERAQAELAVQAIKAMLQADEVKKRAK